MKCGVGPFDPDKIALELLCMEPLKCELYLLVLFLNNTNVYSVGSLMNLVGHLLNELFYL